MHIACVTSKEDVMWMHSCKLFCTHEPALVQYVCLPTCMLRQWWAAGCQRKRSVCDLSCEKRNMSKRRGEAKVGELRGKEGERTPWVSQQDITLLLRRWWIPPTQRPHNYIHPFLPCQQQHWSLTVFGQAAEIMQDGEPRGLKLTFEENTLTKSINKKLQGTRFPL